MGRTASVYERELKELLQGDEAALRRYGRSVPPKERSVLARASDSPFLVVRAAGSLGFDLVALRNEFAFPLEVKASSSDTIRFSSASGRAAAQLAAHQRAVDRVGLVVLYAYRRLGQRNEEPWRIFIAPTRPGGGWIRIFRSRLPVVDHTRDGNGVLRWRDGMPLSRFLELVSYLTQRSDGTAA